MMENIDLKVKKETPVEIEQRKKWKSNTTMC